MHCQGQASPILIPFDNAVLSGRIIGLKLLSVKKILAHGQLNRQLPVFAVVPHLPTLMLTCTGSVVMTPFALYIIT